MSALRPQGAELAAAIDERELLRLLGLPRSRELDGELGERADESRAWYAANGRPFAATRRVDVHDVSATDVRLADGTELRSAALAEGLLATHGHAVVVLAVSAGREVAAETSRLWGSDRPDAAYFLDRFAVAVTEALVRWSSASECREASRAGETLLPPLSPGCGRFEMGDQQRLMRLLGADEAPGPLNLDGSLGEGRLSIGPVQLLTSGALDPPHSLLAAFGVTRQALAEATPDDLCRACELDPCAFRRAPFAKRVVLQVGR